MPGARSQAPAWWKLRWWAEAHPTCLYQASLSLTHGACPTRAGSDSSGERGGSPCRSRSGPISMRRGCAPLPARARMPAQARRLLALAAIYDGASRTEAARIGGVTLQIVRDWVLQVQRARPGRADRPQGARSAVAAERRAPRGAGRGDRERADPGDPWRGALADHRSVPVAVGRVPGQRRQADARAASCARWAIASCRPGRAIMRRPRARSRLLKKFPRASGRDRARATASPPTT